MMRFGCYEVDLLIMQPLVAAYSPFSPLRLTYMTVTTKTWRQQRRGDSRYTRRIYPPVREAGLWFPWAGLRVPWREVYAWLR